MSRGHRGKIIPFLCASTLYRSDACNHAPLAFFTLHNPSMFCLSSKLHIWQTCKKSSFSLGNLSDLGSFFSLSHPKLSTPPQKKSHQRFTKEMTTALPHLSMHTIFPALDMVAFSSKAGLCSPTNLLMSASIPSCKTGVSWVVFVRVVISTHAQSLAFGLTKCTLLLQAVSPVHQNNFEI